jgi:hypothetical protein
MGTCCSKKQNSIVYILKSSSRPSIRAEAVILVNNQENTFEKIKISKKKTEGIGIDISGI